MAFETFDLGKVIQTAEAIKGLRRQATTDRLQEQYLQGNITGQQQQQQFAANAEQRAQSQFNVDEEARNARRNYLQADAVLRSDDPIRTVREFVPEVIDEWNKTHGAGSFEQLTPDQVRHVAALVQDKAAAQAGIQRKITWQDQGAQLMPFDESGRPVQGLAPINKTASPESQLAAQTSRANNAANVAAENKRAELTAGGKEVRTTQQLRKEFRGLQTVKDYEAVLPLIESARNAPDTPQGDLQLIYTVGKVLDPGSVVREGELALTANAAPFLQQIVGRARKELGSGRLTPQTRSDMVNMLQQRVQGYQQAYTRDFDQYSQYAREGGVDAASVVGSRPESAFGQPQGATQADFIYVPGKGLQPAGQ